MKPRSAKNKGKRLQNKVRDLILEKFNSKLEPDDVRSITMGDSGEDILLSPAARRLFPFSVYILNGDFSIGKTVLKLSYSPLFSINVFIVSSNVSTFLVGYVGLS